jgi:UDP-glucose 4-epimerase
VKILVTGGAGFIGSRLVDALVQGGAEVEVLDDLSTGWRIPKGAAFTRGDVRDGIPEKAYDVLFHLAARVSVRGSLADPLEDASVNVLGGIAVLRDAAALGVKRMIFSSSGGTVYGEGRGRPSREGDPLDPRSPYGAAKAAVETYAKCDPSLGFTCLRLSNVYGPGQDPEGESGVIARFLSRLREGRPLEVYGDGRQVRDYVYVEDVIGAFLSAMAGPAGTYNIGTGVGTTLLELIELLGRPAQVIHRPAIAGELRENVLDVRRAFETLGWSQRVSLREGLALTAGCLASP